MKSNWTRAKLARELDQAIKSGKIVLTPFDGCCNGRPSAGWTYGYPDISWCGRTALVIPWRDYWSGSLPTPSTQYPQSIVDYARKIGAIV